MKNLALLVFILISKITFAQHKDTVGLNTPFINGEVVYQRVFNAPGKSRAQLFSNAQIWFIKRYHNANIQIQDESAGRVVGYGAELLNFKMVLGIDYTHDTNMAIQIDCKNNKYRVRIFNIVIITEDKGKHLVYAEQLMNDLVGIKTNVAWVDYYPNTFNKNQSKKALKSLNTLIDNMTWSIDQNMNEADDF